MSGIYCIRNKVNDKFYIGQTIRTFEDRWDEHRNDLNADKHRNPHLQNAWKKYGEEAFEFSVWLETCPDKNVLNFWEKAAIGDDYNDRSRCYNMREGGGNRGRLSDESRRKNSESQKGKKHTKEHRRKIAVAKLGEKNPMWGKPRNEETKRKISLTKKAKPAITCPWCGTTGRGGNMKRYHLDNCKHKEA
jgi:group I intron endonuclease